MINYDLEVHLVTSYLCSCWKHTVKLISLPQNVPHNFTLSSKHAWISLCPEALAHSIEFCDPLEAQNVPHPP